MRTKTLFILLIASLVAINTLAQSRKIVKENRQVSAFSSIKASSGWDIVIRQGNKPSVSIEANEDIMKRTVVEVRNAVLHIYNEKSDQTFSLRNLRDSRNTTQKAYITVVDLKKITTSGGVDIRFETPLLTADFEIVMSGGSDLENLTLSCDNFEGTFSGGCDAEITFSSVRNVKANISGGSDVKLLDISAPRCDITASGGCDVRLSGKTRDFTINANGGSDVSAFELEAQDCTADFSGSADGELFVTNRLDIRVSGSSDVTCKGNPREVTKTVNKSSSLKMR